MRDTFYVCVVPREVLEQAAAIIKHPGERQSLAYRQAAAEYLRSAASKATVPVDVLR